MTTLRRGTAIGLVALALLGCADDGDNPCDGIDCSGRGYCLLNDGSPFCGCIPGFHTVARTTCQADDTTDPCRDIDCLGHGTCLVVGGSPTCDCAPGYEHLQHVRCSEINCELLCVSGSTADGGPETDACLPGSPELCDETDNDCNGLVDEAFDLDFDSLNCGACGRNCQAASHGTASCVLGGCAMICEPGWADLNHDPADGCEAVCTPADVPDESLCEGLDDDCDGLTDEDWVPYNVCGLGVCRRQELCHRGGISCRARVPPSASDTTCDGMDDDCDGATDDECSVGADADADVSAEAEAEAGADADVPAEADTYVPPSCGNGTVEWPEECEGSSTRPCGSCDSGTQPCTASCTWGTCVGATGCTPGETEYDSCLCGGTESRTCTSSCTWGAWSGCTPGDCIPDAIDPCGRCDSGTRTCQSDCTWGICTGATGCSPGAVQTRDCLCGGTESRTCTSSCTWGAWSGCTSGVCTPDEIGSRACTCGGTETRTCTSSCTWGAWSGCTSGVCTPSATRSCTASTGCPGTQTCTSSCAWGTCTAPAACTDYYGDTICNGRTSRTGTGCSYGFCRTCTCSSGSWVSCGTCDYCPI